MTLFYWLDSITVTRYGVAVDAKEFNESLVTLRLSGAGLQRLTGASLSTVSRCRNGKAIPPQLAQLIRMYVKLEEMMADLEEARRPTKGKRRRR